MDRQGSRADRLVDAFGAFAAGTGAGAWAWLAAASFGYSPILWSVAFGAIGAVAGWLIMLSATSAKPSNPPFEPATIDFAEESNVLLLETEADVLLLSDELLELEPDARVVRLFAPAPVPSPGQLSARIERHLARSNDAPDDATAALHAALHDIRRTLNRP